MDSMLSHFISCVIIPSNWHTIDVQSLKSWPNINGFKGLNDKSEAFGTDSESILSQDKSSLESNLAVSLSVFFPACGKMINNTVKM